MNSFLWWIFEAFVSKKTTTLNFLFWSKRSDLSQSKGTRPYSQNVGKNTSQWLLEHAKTIHVLVSENKKSYDDVCRGVYEKYNNELEQFLSVEVQYLKPLNSPKKRNRDKSAKTKFAQEKLKVNECCHRLSKGS